MVKLEEREDGYYVLEAKYECVTLRKAFMDADKPLAEIAQEHKAKLYWKGAKVATYKFTRKPKVKFVTPDGLTYKKLTHRKGKILYVEVCVGKVLDNKGNGKILNTRSKYNYISYRRTGFRKGTKVRTYLVYSPYNNHEDGIVKRFDEKMS